MDKNILVSTPERAVQLFSFKVSEKREQILQQQVGQSVRYRHPDTNKLKTGVINKIHNGLCYMYCNSDKEIKIPIDKVIWDTI